MSKTIRAIVAVGVGVAVFAVTGNLTLALAAYSVTSAAESAVFQKSPRSDRASTALKSPIPARVFSFSGDPVRVHGTYVLYEAASDGSAVDAFAFLEGPITSVGGYYLGDDKITVSGGGWVQQGADKRYGDGDVIQVKANLGAATETAWAEVIAKLPDIWTIAHRGDGVVTGFMISAPVKAKNYQEVYPTGGPNQTPLSIVVVATPVFDWRDPTQSVADRSTWKPSASAVLQLAAYQLLYNGKTWARHFAPTLGYWTAAADDADVAMPLKDGGTEARYRACVVAQTTDEPKTVVSSYIGCCDGWMAPREDGALVIYSGRYYTPTVSIGPDEIVTYSWENGIEDEGALNEIPVSYVSSAHDYSVVDADAWTDEADVANRGRIRSNPLANQVPSHAQVRRLAKRKMAQVMAPMRGTVTTTSAGAGAVGQRFIHLRLAEAEGTPDEFVPYNGPAEITQLRRNLQTGAVSFSWIAADPNIDNWNPATEEGDPAPVGDRVAREPLAPPTITTAVATYADDSGAGTTGAKVTLDITAPDRADLTWYAHTRVAGAALWGADQTYSDIDETAAVQIITGFVPTDASVEVQVAYQVGDGRVSPWSGTATVNTSTAGLAPASPTEIAATSAVGHSVVSWRNPSSANLSYVVLFRGTGTTFGAAAAITGHLVGALGQVMSVDDTGLAAGTYRYWIVAYNAGGTGSVPDGPAVATVS